MKWVLTILVSLCSLLFSSSALAQSYQWKDKDGNIFFGNKPPRGAKRVEKVKAKSFSRYSSSKALAPYAKQENISAPPPPETKANSDTPELREPPKLVEDRLSLRTNNDGHIVGCQIRIKNTGAMTANNVTVSFEFHDGTIIQAQGDETIDPQASALYSVPESFLPLKLEPSDTERAVLDPSIIVQFSEDA